MVLNLLNNQMNKGALPVNSNKSNSVDNELRNVEDEIQKILENKKAEIKKNIKAN